MRHVPIDSTPIRSAAATARFGGTARSAVATTSHRTGAGATISNAVALTAPIDPMTSAHRAASRHRVRVAAPMVRPTIQPSPAHGRSIDEVRDTYGTRYGDNW